MNSAIKITDKQATRFMVDAQQWKLQLQKERLAKINQIQTEQFKEQK